MFLRVGNKIVNAKIVKIDKSGYLITFQKITSESEGGRGKETEEITLPAQLVHPLSTYTFWNGNILCIKCPEIIRKIDLHRYKCIFKEHKEEEKRIAAICKRILKNNNFEKIRLDPCLKRDLNVYRSGIQKAKLRSPQHIMKYKNIQRLAKLVNDDIVLEGCFECSEVLTENEHEEEEHKAHKTIRILCTGHLEILDHPYDKFKLNTVGITKISKLIRWLKNYNLPTIQQLSEKFTTEEIMSSFLPNKIYHSPFFSSSSSSSKIPLPKNVIEFYQSKPYIAKTIDIHNFDTVCHFVTSLRQLLTQPPIESELEELPNMLDFHRIGILQPQNWSDNEMAQFLLRLPRNTSVVPLGLNENDLFFGNDFPNMIKKSIPNPTLENLLNTQLTLPRKFFKPLRALIRALHNPKIQESIIKWYIEGDCEIDNETIRIIFNTMGLIQHDPQTGKYFFGTKEIREELSQLLNEENTFNQSFKNENLKRAASLQKLQMYTNLNNNNKTLLLIISPDETDEIYTLLKNREGIETWKATPHPYKDEFSITNFLKNFISYLINQTRSRSRNKTTTCLFLNTLKWKRSLLSRIIYFTQINNYKILGYISM